MRTSRRDFLAMAATVGVTSPARAADHLRKSKGRCEEPSAAKPWPLYRSESFTLKWRDRIFLIGIARPFDVDPELPLMLRGYKPVPIYVTDATENFPIVASTTRQMQWGGEVPPCLVVGIDYLDVEGAERHDWRRRELTPTARPAGHGADSDSPMGLAAEFRAFLLEELRPTVERRFDVDSSRSLLMGHSLGGMFTLDTMVQEPGAFGNYLALSPSLWFDDDLVLRRFRHKLSTGAIFRSRVVVLAGEQEERISPAATHMTSNTLEFGRLVAEHRSSFPNGALVSVLPQTTHHTIVGAGVARGVRFLIAPEDRRSETF